MALFNFGSPQYVNLGGILTQIDYRPNGVVQLNLLTIPVFSQGIELLSKDAAQTPLNSFIVTPQGRQRFRNSLDYMLSVRPNARENASVFWETFVKQGIIYQSFARIDPVDGLVRLPFGCTSAYKTPDGEWRVATYVEEKTTTNETRKIIEADYPYSEVIHFAASLDEHGCAFPLNVRFCHLLNFGTGLYSYSTNLYNRGGQLAGYLYTPQKVSDKATKNGIIKGFKKLFKSAAVDSTDGSDIKISALDNGWEFRTLNLSPQELMIMEQKKDFKLDAAAILNLPPWKVGLLEDYKYASAEQANRDYQGQSLNPIYVQIEREINHKFISDTEREALGMYVEFNREKIIQVDTKTQTEIEDLRIKNGSMAPDEVALIHNAPTSHPGRLVPVQYQTQEFAKAAEALKLEGLALDNELKAAQLKAAAAPKPPEPPDASAGKPTPTASEGSNVDPGGSNEAADGLRALQAAVYPMLPDGLSAAMDKARAAIEAAHSLSAGTLDDFAAAYVASAEKRKGDSFSPAYEANRMINALNHEAIKRAYGVKKAVRWIGGEFNGQSKSVMETWKDNLRHPPLSKDDTDSFIIH